MTPTPFYCGECGRGRFAPPDTPTDKPQLRCADCDEICVHTTVAPPEPVGFQIDFINGPNIVCNSAAERRAMFKAIDQNSRILDRRGAVMTTQQAGEENERHLR